MSLSKDLVGGKRTYMKDDRRVVTAMELDPSNYGTSKAKRYISYDFYCNRDHSLSLEGDVYELDKFKSKSRFVVLVPTKSDNTLPWDYTLVGQLVAKRRYPMVSEVGKTATLSLIKDVEDNFDAGHCFTHFDSSNITLTLSGHVLLKNVKLVNPSYDARKENLEDLYNTVKGFFDEHVPPDVDHLLTMMNAKTSTRLYSIHTSLVPHTNKGWAFIQMYELVKRKLGRVDREQILLHIPYHDEWRALVQRNSVLAETYGFIEGAYDPSTESKSDIDRQIESAGLLLDFFRNGLSHRSQRSLITNVWQFDLILLVMFPLLLPFLQKAILDVLDDKGHKILQGIFRPLM